MGLSTVPDYTTVELTAQDIGLILKTLWSRADDIPVQDPFQRVVFHALVILFSFGFRQGMIIGMKYRDVISAIIRDPVDRKTKRPVTTFTIWRNKLRRNALEHKKGDKHVFLLVNLSYFTVF